MACATTRALRGAGEAGASLGAHQWCFEPTLAGVRVITTEPFAGDPVNADTGGMQVLLHNSLVALLGRLKTEAKRRR